MWPEITLSAVCFVEASLCSLFFIKIIFPYMKYKADVCKASPSASLIAVIPNYDTSGLITFGSDNSMHLFHLITNIEMIASRSINVCIKCIPDQRLFLYEESHFFTPMRSQTASISQKLPSSRWRLFRWRIESSVTVLFSPPFHLFWKKKKRSASKPNNSFPDL